MPEGSKVFVLGAQHLREEVSKQGLEVVDRAEEQPVAAIQGWYPDMSWNEMAQIAYAVEHGATYFVTNRDLTIPRELGIAPGCGSMIMAVINATGVEPVSSAASQNPPCMMRRVFSQPMMCRSGSQGTVPRHWRPSRHRYRGGQSWRI